MKKKVLGIALLTLSVVSFSSMAQNCDKGRRCPTEQICRDSTACKGLRHAMKDPFAGLNLTEAQKTQLQELRSQCKAERDANKQATKADKAAKKENRKAAKEEAKRAYLQKVKAILTPEQYTTWLENRFVDSNCGKKPRMGHGDKNRPHKEMKGKRDPRKAGKDFKGSKMSDGQQRWGKPQKDVKKSN